MAKVPMVEDDYEIRALLHDLLHEEGFHVSVARNGKEPLEILQREAGGQILLAIAAGGTHPLQRPILLHESFIHVKR